MSSFLDFAEIKASNPIEKVAERLGLDLKPAGNQFRCPCPSGEGGERALCITPSKGAWYSFALKRGGDVISLVQLVNDCDAKEAARFIAHEPLEKPKGRPKEGSKPSEGFAPLTYLEPDHPAVEALQLTAIAEQVGIGYAPRGLLRGLVALPIRLPDGRLIGYVGVSEVKAPPKWSV